MCCYQEPLPPKRPILAILAFIFALVGLIMLLSCNSVKQSKSSIENNKDSSYSDIEVRIEKLSSDSTVTQNDNGTYQRAFIWNGGNIVLPYYIDSSKFFHSVDGLIINNVHDTVFSIPAGYSYYEKGTYNRDKKTSVHKEQDQHYNIYHHFNVTTHYKAIESTKDNHRTAWWLPVLFVSIVAGAGLYLFNKFSNPIISFIKNFK